MNHVLILANGDWGTSRDDSRLRQMASRADHIIATDGALDLSRARGIHVDTLVGDLDSIQDASHLDQRFPGMEVVRYPREKDFTDLELAIDWALETSPTSITLFGVAGNRLDHTMANLALLEKGLHTGTPMTAVSGNETIRLIQDELTLDEAVVGDRVSLLPVSLFVTVSTQGLQYRLVRDKLFRGRSRGVSNAVCGTPVRIVVESGILAVVHAVGAREEG